MNLVRASEDANLPTIPGYVINERLGQGGMGIVYKALRQSDLRWVALKMIVGTHPQLKQRFRREVNATARLRHPHIVELYDTGEHGGWPYFTMELVTGGSLAENRSRFVGDVAASVELIERMARAVQHAHELGVVHRDLKPGNVLLSFVGQEPLLAPDDAKDKQSSLRFEPKISDFGLAKCLDGDDTLTNTSAIMGTPAYMAPEVARGEMRDAGPGVDIYALGAILYELLTGQVPFRGSTMEVLDRIRNTPPPAPRSLRPNLPRRLESICLACLEKQPANRPDSAQFLAEELLRALGEESMPDRDIPPTTTNQPTLEPTTDFARVPPGEAAPQLPGFESLELMSDGSLPEIYRAKQARLRRTVAIRLPSPLIFNERVAARYRVEAEVLSGLQHPNIVHLFDVGEYDGRPYLVYEFLDGGTLASRLKRGSMSEEEAVALIVQLARAAHHLHHALGLLTVHRNISPGSIMFTSSGVPKLIGFGLIHAPALGTNALESQTHLEGAVNFMAPEVARAAMDEYGPGTDVYGLGATLYKMLTGRPPFGAVRNMDDVMRMMKENPAPPRAFGKVSRRVETVCLKALAKDAYDRHSSAQELAEDLERARKGWLG